MIHNTCQTSLDRSNFCPRKYKNVTRLIFYTSAGVSALNDHPVQVHLLPSVCASVVLHRTSEKMVARRTDEGSVIIEFVELCQQYISPAQQQQQHHAVPLVSSRCRWRNSSSSGSSHFASFCKCMCVGRSDGWRCHRVTASLFVGTPRPSLMRGAVLTETSTYTYSPNRLLMSTPGVFC